MNVGIRVVRGPDWSWWDQDGGPGHVGTVIQILEDHSMVFVRWDSGSEIIVGGFVGNYRIDGKHDLRVLDSSAAGIQFVHYCDVCGERGMKGTRWACVVCHDYDLCTDCYMTDKHDTSHGFRRYDIDRDHSVEVPPRSLSRKADYFGMYTDSQVLRDVSECVHNDLDGCFGVSGTVLKTGKTPGLVKVKWSDGPTYDHPLGKEGKVDVYAVTPTKGGTYYIDHLAILDRTCFPGGLHRRVANVGQEGKSDEEIKREKIAAEEARQVSLVFTGDKSEELEDSDSDSDVENDTRDDIETHDDDDNNSHDDFPFDDDDYFDEDDDDDSIKDDDDTSSQSSVDSDNDEMMNQILRRLLVGQGDDGQFNLRSEGGRLVLGQALEGLGAASRNLAALLAGAETNPLDRHHGTVEQGVMCQGDRVQIDPMLTVEELEVLQKERGTGGWNKDMAPYIGRVGTVVNLAEGGPVRVEFKTGSEAKPWVLNAKCLTSKIFMIGDIIRVSGDERDVRERQKGHGGWMDCMKTMIDQIYSVADVNEGSVFIQWKDCLLEINSWSCLLETSAEDVSREELENENFTVDRVRKKLNAGLNPCASVDQKGNSFVHSVVLSGDNSEALELILNRSLPEVIELVNFDLHSLLHCAVQKKRIKCARLLSKYGVILNLKDNGGNTSLHMAISQAHSSEYDSFVELLTEPSSYDYDITNDIRWNVLQLAANCDNAYAVNRILQRNGRLLNSIGGIVRDRISQLPVHIAAGNGSLKSLRTFLDYPAYDRPTSKLLKKIVTYFGPNPSYVCIEGPTVYTDKKCLEQVDGNRRLTPLLAAVILREAASAEYLVHRGANVDAVDADGDTCIHNVLYYLMANPIVQPVCRIEQSTQVKMIFEELPEDVENRTWISIVCFLVMSGASLDLRNQKGLCARDLIRQYGKGLDVLVRKYQHRSLERTSPDRQMIKAQRRITQPNTRQSAVDSNLWLRPNRIKNDMTENGARGGTANGGMSSDKLIQLKVTESESGAISGLSDQEARVRAGAAALARAGKASEAASETGTGGGLAGSSGGAGKGLGTTSGAGAGGGTAGTGAGAAAGAVGGAVGASGGAAGAQGEIDEDSMCLSCARGKACVEMIPCGHMWQCLECNGQADMPKRCLVCLEPVIDTNIQLSFITV